VADGAADRANSFLVRQAKAYITQHHAEKLTLQEVADHCYVSQWHLSKMLNKHLEKNFYDILNSARIHKAKELLEDPAMRISEISAEVGYTDTAHFSRVFKKLEGVSANEYRNRRSGTT
ncbi:MAG: AraC family transcriptional regulator, partial [Oscillospiraceae bacterium]